MGIAEFFNTYSYGVILNESYNGSDIYESYCLDFINKSEFSHNPSRDVSVDMHKFIKQQFHPSLKTFLTELKFRADQVMKL